MNKPTIPTQATYNNVWGFVCWSRDGVQCLFSYNGTEWFNVDATDVTMGW